MNSKLSKWIGAIKKATRIGLQRFPEAIIFTVLTTITFIVLNHIDQTGNYEENKSIVDILGNIGMVLALGIPAFLVKSVLFERFADRSWAQNKNVRPLTIILIIASLTAYYFTLQGDTDFVTGARYFVLNASLYIMFLFIPYILRRNHFEKYILFVLLRFAVTYLFTSIIVAGFSAIILTIDALFNLSIAGNLLLDVALIASGIFAPIFFLSYIPKYEDNMEQVEYVPFLRILLMYIVMPILAIYTVVLVIYLLTILITMTWPKGTVSNLVLWFSLISTFILFISYPIRELNQWSKQFTRYFPIALIPMLLMMFVAVFIRIKAYGITESRYIVVAVGIWLFATMIYLSIGRNVRNIWLPITFVIILIVAVLSPLNLFAISKYSQNDRLEKILTKYEMIKDGSFVKLPKEQVDKISKSDREQLEAIFTYFNDSHEIKDIRTLPKEFKLTNSIEYFGFEWQGNKYFDETGQTKQFYHNLTKIPVLDVKEYDYVLDFNSYNYENQTINRGDLKVRYLMPDQIVNITKGDIILDAIQIRSAAKEIHLLHKNKTELTQAELSRVFENESFKVTVQFSSIAGMSDEAGTQITVDNVPFYLLINEK
jgi:hypothetical protein